MGLNLIATAAKLVVGYGTNSLSLIADGYDSVFDSATNVIGLISIAMAARPADEGHPYGHRKAETMASMIISSVLFLTTWELAKSGIEHLRHPDLINAEVNAWSFGALIVSIAVHLGVVWYEMRAGRRLQSDILIADAMHTRADVFLSISVMVGLIAVRLGFPLADPILALVVAVLIAKIGIDILRESSPVLMDQAAFPVDRIEQVALSVPGVISCHRVRSRGHEGDVFADLHIQVDPDLSTERAHGLAHEVADRLRSTLPGIQDVTIHVEPSGQSAGGESIESVVARIRQIAAQMGMHVHNGWAYQLRGQLYATVHLELDHALSLRQAHEYASQLEARVHESIPDLAQLMTHIEPDSAEPAALSRQDSAAVRDKVARVAEKVVAPGACHEIQIHPFSEGWMVSMHCRLPGESSLSEAHALSVTLEQELRRRIPNLGEVLIHTEPDSTLPAPEAEPESGV